MRFEDQLIVLRYARNLVEGNGLVYNAGERIQGFTTPLFTLLSTGAVVFGGDDAAVWQNAFGVVCIVGTAILAVRVLSRADAAGASPLAVALILYFPIAGYPALFLGMEVHLFAFLLLLALDLHLAKRSTLAAIVTGLLFLTRPEGVLLSAILFGHNWITTRRPPFREAIAALLTVAPWLLFATAYYGTPVTTTLGAKSGLSSPWDYAVGVVLHQGQRLGELTALWTGWDSSTNGSLGNILMSAAPVAAAVAGAAVLLTRRPQLWPLLAFPLAWLATYASIGAPLLHRWHYYFLNVVAAILVSAGLHAGIVKAARVAKERLLRRRPSNAASQLLVGRQVPAVVAWVGAIVVALPILLATRSSLASAAEIGPQLTDPRSIPGPWLRDHYDADTSVYALEIGFLGWQSGLRVVDGAGLVTPGLSQTTALIEILEQHLPDLLLLPAAPTGRPPDHLWTYQRVEEFDEVGSDYLLYTNSPATSSPAVRYDVERDSNGRIDALVRNAVGGSPTETERIPIVRAGQLRGQLDSTLPSPPPSLTATAAFTLKGWAIDQSPEAAADTVVAFVGGIPVASSGVGLPRRPDVVAAFGAEYEYSGFALRLRAQRERIEREGVVVYAISESRTARRLPFAYWPLIRADGGEILPTSDGRRLTVRPVAGQLGGAIDLIRASANGTVIEGWAADLEYGERPRQIVIYRDGEFLANLGISRDRPDVVERHGDPRLLRTGFRGTVAGVPDPETFGERHRVFAVMLRGAAVELPFATSR